MKGGLHRPFLKWAGNKFAILEQILARLPAGERLIEPFAGSCAVSLNSTYSSYLIADVNPDLILLYRILQQDGERFIEQARELFTPENNSEQRYYQLREQFNNTGDRMEKAILFLYLNRHCYNGLCRYNRSHRFNVPFGRYKKPYFPEEEMRRFCKMAQRAEFLCGDFRTIFTQAQPGSVIYADPPYIPLNSTAYFTSYSSGEFAAQEQQELAEVARQAAGRGIPVLISNHDTPFARTIYSGASLTHFQVQRHISRNVLQRNKAAELLALFEAG